MGRNSISAPGPNHKPGDRSMTITIRLDAPDGFVVHSFSPRDDDLACKDYVREKWGLGSWKPKAVQRPKLRVVNTPLPLRIEGGPIDENLLMGGDPQASASWTPLERPLAVSRCV
jgi:hypothetical protein